MGNLATITIFSRISFEKTEYLFLGDEYFRMKICRFPQIYEILSIWIPFERTPDSLALLSFGVVVLFRAREIQEKIEKTQEKVEKTQGKVEKNAYFLVFIDRVCMEKEDFCGETLSFPTSLGGRTNEKLRIFTVDQGKSLFGVLAQHDVGEGTLEIEVFLVGFEGNHKVLLVKRRESFRNQGKVKFIGVFGGLVVLQRKEKSGFIEKTEQNAIKSFEKNGCGFYTVNLL